MMYAMCPQCGRKLCKGEARSKLEIECPKCKQLLRVSFENNGVKLSKKPFDEDPIPKIVTRSYI